MFDAYVGEPGTARYLNPDELAESLNDLFPLVPVVYRGPFSLAKLQELTDGATTLEAGTYAKAWSCGPPPSAFRTSSAG